MALTVAAAFTQFEATIQPTKAQIDGLRPKVNTTVSYLTKAFPATSNMPLDRTVLIGSAAQNTITQPIDDIDLMAVFSDASNIWENSYRNNSQAFIQRVRGAFDGCSIQTIGVRGQAVRLFYQQGAHVDIAPVFSWSAGGYILPAGNGTWIRTNPDVQAQWFANQNQRLGYQLLPMIRLLKKWNAAHGKQFKSFHLSVVTANTFGSLSTNRAHALAKFFEWAPNWLDAQDPAGHGGNLASNLTMIARLNLTTRLSNAAIRANNALLAEQRGDHREAIRLWGLEFGSGFPSYG